MKLHNPFTAAIDNDQGFLWLMYMCLTSIVVGILTMWFIQVFSFAHLVFPILILVFARMLYAVFTGK